MAPSLKDQFDTDGFVRIEGAVPSDLIDPLRRRMANATSLGDAQGTVKLGDDPEAATLMATPSLRTAFNTLLGPGGWVEPAALEDLRVKFPGPRKAPWWHVDVFERGPQTRDDDLLSWRTSARCGGVGLLMLLLLSDISKVDGATALRAGSHRTVARRLDAAGDGGLSLGELLAFGIDEETADASVTVTTGLAGTAFLCHPMLVHAALPHTNVAPSYWALPPVRL